MANVPVHLTSDIWIEEVSRKRKGKSTSSLSTEGSSCTTPPEPKLKRQPGILCESGNRIAFHLEYNYNIRVGMLREFAPKDKALLEQKDGLAEAVQTADTTRSLELLKRWSASWSPVKDTPRERACLGEGF